MATAPTRPERPLVEGIALALVVGIAAALRWPYLAKGLWWDEYDVVYFASMPIEQLLRAFAVLESHPPLYALIGKLGLGLAGDGPVGIRLASFAAGIATIPGVYLLGRCFAGRAVALGAAALLAISPLHVDFSTNARCLYPLFTGFTVWSSAALAMLWTHPERQRRWALFYGVITGLSLLTHYYTVLVVASQALFYLRYRGWHRISPGLLAAACGLAAAIFYPWFWMSNILPTSAAFGRALTPWVPPLGLTTVVEIVEEFVRRAMTPLHATAVLSIFGLLALRGVRHSRRRSPHGALPGLVVAVALLPPLILAVLSLLLQRSHGSAVLQPRQFIMVAPAVSLLMAMALRAFESRLATRVLIVGLVGSSLAGLPTWIPSQARIVDDLRSRIAPGDVVAVHPMLSFQVFAYHAGGRLSPNTQLVPLVEFDDTPERAVARLDALSERARRLWIVERRLDRVGQDDLRSEVHRRVTAHLEHIRRPVDVTLYRGAIPWQVRRYELPADATPLDSPVSDVAPPTVEVGLRFADSLLGRNVDLVDPRSTRGLERDVHALAPERWFGALETPTPPPGSTRSSAAKIVARGVGPGAGARVQVPADGERRVYVEATSAGGFMLSALPVRIEPGPMPERLHIEMGGSLLPTWFVSLADRIGRACIALGLLLEALRVAWARRPRRLSPR